MVNQKSLDLKIYEIDKQLELLEMYVKLQQKVFMYKNLYFIIFKYKPIIIYNIIKTGKKQNGKIKTKRDT